MSEIGGLNIGSMFKTASASIEKDGAALQSKIDSLSGKSTIDQSELLQLQFAMGQYNAKIETISATTKSMLETLKSLSQRTG